MIKEIVTMNRIIDILNLSTSSCNRVFELFFLLSCWYKFFENGEVAIIDNAVIVKPVVIDKKVATTSNALLFKLTFIENINMIKTENIINKIFLCIFLFYFID
jgi:hypothetical protein